jgi:hypothetical protein
VAIEGPTRPVAVGDTGLARVVFQQGATDPGPGGVDAIAAATMTIGIPGLSLADCSAPGPDGLNPSFTLLPGASGRYRAVVQNLTCDGRGSCLCPGTGELRDPYVNLLLIGLPGAGGVQTLPNGEVLSIALRVRPETAPRVRLHVYSALDEPGEFPLPAAGAAFSVGDNQAVDRTVDTGTDTLNVRLVDGELTTAQATPPTAAATATATATGTQPSATATVEPTAAPPTVTATVGLPDCPGDCNDSGEITVNELIAGVRILLGSLPLSTCRAFDCTGTGEVGVSCLIAGVNAALDGCPE